MVSLYIMLSPLYGDDDAKENLGRFIDAIVPHRLPPDDQPINSQR
ncbi:hypothetical protein LTSEADE_1757 [Salmonella enterica subsp. enterica serovar Adelaide str. A4-669]|uniref:Uncharacterized protein n=1 Tax=Salmonella enterica subsp. enterica serovar Adelaide str. A4-669 TaxID=913063 RepID=A0A6C8GPX1_SALET|nr:hypothetical protein LTSEADE_1757 [Salmonella enterica subsp. enterica serovar Adelaide str. A4-669]